MHFTKESSQVTCTKQIPTPPEAAVISTLSFELPSSFIPATPLAHWTAVRPVTGRLAPSTAETFGGVLTVEAIGAIAYSAREPPFCNSKDRFFYRSGFILHGTKYGNFEMGQRVTSYRAVHHLD